MTDLSLRATEISQNMARAAATQQFILKQTQMVSNAAAIVQSQGATATAQSQGATATAQSQGATATAQSQGATATAQSQDATATAQSQDATATAQSQDATATDSTYILNVTQTAQVQALLDVQATHTDQANATLAAYALTATPLAAIQADIVRTQNTSERRAWWGDFVATPLKVILLTLVILLLIVGGVVAYGRLMPVLELRLRTISRNNDSPLLLVDGTIVDHEPANQPSTHWVLRQPNLPQFPSYETPQVEIVDPLDPSVALWISETEQKLRTDGRIQL
jgi:hypothetical protein